MLFAHWMLLIVTLLPIVAVSFVKFGKGYDNSQPRAYMEGLEANNVLKRLAWAEQNSWEALMMFAPAVLLATILHANTSTVNLLAGLFVVIRLVYLWCYAKDLASLRSRVWTMGVVCVIGLYIASAMA